jgi:hypothetical protein
MLINIPHLPVPIFFDAEKVESEISKIPYEFLDYVSGLSNGIDMDLYTDNWKSLALYSIDGSINSDPKEAWTGEFKRTELNTFCPYLYDLVDQFGGSLLARIEKVMPNGSVGWHSHVMEGKQPEWISVFQLPIIMPETSKYSVVSYMDYRGSDYKKKFKVYEQRYIPGQVYVLNSYHYHNAFNYGENPMLMIRIYADTRDPAVQEILQKSMDVYNGEFIQSYDEFANSIGVA